VPSGRLLITSYLLSLLAGLSCAAGAQAANPPTMMASLRPEPVWHRTSPKTGEVEGPVLYQIIFRSSATPGNVPKIANNFTLANSPIAVTGSGIQVSGDVQSSGHFIGDGSQLTNLPSSAGGTVTSVGFSAAASDFVVTGAPITGNGTLNLNWNIAPTNSNTASAIVKRDASGNFSAGSITAAHFIGDGSLLTNLPGGGGGGGTVTSVGLTAAASDFVVTGSPVTGSGTLNLNWNIAPTSSNTPNSIVKRDANGTVSIGNVIAQKFFGDGSQLINLPIGITNVGLAAPASDFVVSGSPVTSSGTLSFNWNVVPSSSNVGNAIVKRDASGNFSAGSITATASAGPGVIGNGSGSSAGVTGVGGSGGGQGVVGNGSGGGNGVIGSGSDNGNGVVGTGGGKSGDGGFFSGGALNGDGVFAAGNGMGVGIRANGGNNNGNGVVGSGSGAGNGVVGNGSGTGAGVVGNGGAGSGVGGSFNGGTPNGDAITGVGAGTGSGVKGFGGVGGGSGGFFDGSGQGFGVLATGGSNSGAGGRFIGGSPNGDGVQAFGSGTGSAGDFFGTVSITGNLHVTGTVIKGGGSFKIDHPLDPANKYLSHSFVESPDMMNIYNGNVMTDQRGVATVELPGYFSALNRDFRYQLTVIGEFAQAIVAKEVRNNRFTIRTNKPGVKVSWQVTGIRQDAYANAHRIPVEEDKPAEERGHYLHPELFGQPQEKSVGWIQRPYGKKSE